LMLTYVLASNKLSEKKPTKLLAHAEDIEDIKSTILFIWMKYRGREVGNDNFSF
jgi:hypothetical protein